MQCQRCKKNMGRGIFGGICVECLQKQMRKELDEANKEYKERASKANRKRDRDSNSD